MAEFKPFEAIYRVHSNRKGTAIEFSFVEKIVRCKDCAYYQDNNGGYPHDECRWNKDETPNRDDYCSYAEPLEADQHEVL